MASQIPQAGRTHPGPNNRTNQRRRTRQFVGGVSESPAPNPHFRKRFVYNCLTSARALGEMIALSVVMQQLLCQFQLGVLCASVPGPYSLFALFQTEQKNNDDDDSSPGAA